MRKNKDNVNPLKTRFASSGVEAGCDEAGRGALAGPVFAAAVILPDDHNIVGLTDSKMLNESKRKLLRQMIEAKALSWGVARVYPREIEKRNILNASIKAMHLALDKLEIRPSRILVDGNRFRPYGEIESHCIIKGDAKFESIAAASILAKTHRDAYMRKLDRRFPQYHWRQNKGYPTKVHRERIRLMGPCTHHRRSFIQKIITPGLWTT